MILTLTLWVVMLFFSFRKFLEVLAYHAVRNENQIDKNYRKYLHSRVQVYKRADRRNALGKFMAVKSFKPKKLESGVEKIVFS